MTSVNTIDTTDISDIGDTMRPCVICGKDRDLVGEVHRCESAGPIATKALGKVVTTERAVPKPVMLECPVCAARREKRRLAQKRYMDKLRAR